MKTNEDLRLDVMNEIKWDAELQNVATEIGVAAKDGVITLTGLVDTYRKQIAAEKAAQRVAGVKVVASDVKVKLASDSSKTDTEIADAVKELCGGIVLLMKTKLKLRWTMGGYTWTERLNLNMKEVLHKVPLKIW